MLLVLCQAAAKSGVLLLLVAIVEPDPVLSAIAVLLLGIALLVALQYVCTYLGTYVKEQWKMYSYRKFVKLSTAGIEKNPAIYAESELRETRVGGIIGNGSEILGGAIDYCLSIVTAFAIFMVLMITLSTVIEPWLLATMTGSLVACWVVVKHTRLTLTRKSEKAQRRRLVVSRYVQSSWENLSLGNQECLDSWNTQAARALQQFKRSRLASVGANVRVQGILTALSHLPTFFLLFFTLAFNGLGPQGVAKVAVAVPALLQSLNLLTQVAAMAASFYVLKGQFHVLQELVDPAPEVDLIQRIAFDRIQFVPDIEPSLQNVNSFVSDPPRACRLEVRGDNGCGKTSLLLYLKSVFQDRAFYLPAYANLFLGARRMAESTGQRVVRQIEKIMSFGHYHILLLDEWDANLDLQNRNMVNRRLDELCEEGVLIVEARHRQSDE